MGFNLAFKGLIISNPIHTKATPDHYSSFISSIIIIIIIIIW